PMHVGVSYGDPTGGLHGAVAVLAALLHRARTGQGQFIDLSQWETSIAVLPEAVLEWTMCGRQPPRDGNRDPHMAPCGVFRAAGDDRWIALAVEDDAAWARLATLLGRPELAEDALEAIVSAWTAERTPAEATALLQAAGIPAFTATTNRDLAEDAHLAARGFLVALEHPEVGARTHLGVPWRMAEHDCRVRAPAPCLGQHTDEVLRSVCGYDDAAIARLRAAQVLV